MKKCSSLPKLYFFQFKQEKNSEIIEDKLLFVNTYILYTVMHLRHSTSRVLNSELEDLVLNICFRLFS